MEIVSYKKSEDDSSNTRAEFSVRIPQWHMVMNRLKLIRGKSGGVFVSLPSFKEDDVYIPYIEFDADAKKRFTDSALKLVEDHIKNSMGHNIEQQGEEAPF